MIHLLGAALGAALLISGLTVAIRLRDSGEEHRHRRQQRLSQLIAIVGAVLIIWSLSTIPDGCGTNFWSNPRGSIGVCSTR